MKTASIETLASIRPHPNADRLEIATVLGWQCVVKKGEFTAGQAVVFVAPDTILPRAAWSEFLAKDGKPIRLKTIRLRGEYSQGLVLPLSVLPSASQTWNEGADVGAELGVKKYEKEIQARGEAEVNKMNESEKREIKDKVKSFLACERELLEVRQRFFTQGRPVMVKTSRYDGPGVVEHDGRCHMTCVPVRLPNGNVWYYPVECVDPIEEKETK